jgi:hypothetical protein
MNPTPSICNYALLRLLPYPETGEFVNVGVLVMCQQPCLWHFLMEENLPDRARALFPSQNPEIFAAAAKAMRREMERVKSGVRDPKTCQLAFAEAVRPRESMLRFGEPRTLQTDDATNAAEELFRRFVLMQPRAAGLAAA